MADPRRVPSAFILLLSVYVSSSSFRLLVVTLANTDSRLVHLVHLRSELKLPFVPPTLRTEDNESSWLIIIVASFRRVPTQCLQSAKLRNERGLGQYMASFSSPSRGRGNESRDRELTSSSLFFPFAISTGKRFDESSAQESVLSYPFPFSSLFTRSRTS